MGKSWKKAGFVRGAPLHPASCAPFHVPTGGLQAVADLLQVDYEMHKMTQDPLNLALRRYAGMTLTNLTFGDVANKVPGMGRWCQNSPHPHLSLKTVLEGRDSCPQFYRQAD